MKHFIEAHKQDLNKTLRELCAIPAVCGVYRGGGTHTREEWIEKASLPLGLEIAIRAIEQIAAKVAL